MAKERVFSLDAVRTDGWFERIGDGIGSFQALCDIVGEAFFAFSMITGARITALTVDRRNPDNTLVDFVIAAGGEDESDADVQRLTLADFRQRLVHALLTDDTMPAAPERDTDVEALQLHIGVRYLLLAPLLRLPPAQARRRGGHLAAPPGARRHPGKPQTHRGPGGGSPANFREGAGNPPLRGDPPSPL